MVVDVDVNWIDDYGDHDLDEDYYTSVYLKQTLIILSGFIKICSAFWLHLYLVESQKFQAKR